MKAIKSPTFRKRQYIAMANIFGTVLGAEVARGQFDALTVLRMEEKISALLADDNELFNRDKFKLALFQAAIAESSAIYAQHQETV